MDKKKYFQNWNREPMKPSELKISISIGSYHEKTAENYRKYYVAEKRQFQNYHRY